MAGSSNRPADALVTTTMNSATSGIRSAPAGTNQTASSRRTCVHLCGYRTVNPRSSWTSFSPTGADGAQAPSSRTPNAASHNLMCGEFAGRLRRPPKTRPGRRGAGSECSPVNAMVLSSPRPVESAPLERRSLAPPEPRAGEVLLRVRCCGVGPTELHLVEGEVPPAKLPVVPGHQVVAGVEGGGPGGAPPGPGGRVRGGGV